MKQRLLVFAILFIGFESGSTCWHLFPEGAASDYLWSINQDTPHSGKHSLFIRSRHGKSEEGLVWQRVDAQGLHGQRAKITVALKRSDNQENVALQYIELFYRKELVNEEKIIALNAQSGEENQEWAIVEFIVDVSDEATNIIFGIKLMGSGQIWVDDFAIEVIDSEIQD